MDQRLEEWFDLNVQQITSTTELLGKKLDSMSRRKISNLLIGDLHNRDTAQNLLVEGVETLMDFFWQKTLRYYWENDENVDNCVVKQFKNPVIYGYEYLGCFNRLIVTPLTERCWVTVTNAQGLGLGTSAMGPAGTGKTETIKDLAKVSFVVLRLFIVL